MSKKGDKVDFTNPPKWDCPPFVGFVVTDEMRKILAQPGYLNRTNGGPRLTHLYSNQSMGFRVDEFSDFGQSCFCGGVNQMQRHFLMGTNPPLTNTESSYRFGYASMVVTGSQRISQAPGGPRPEHLATLELLISRGVPLDVPDIGGFTALQHSIMGTSHLDKEKIIRTLLASGANVNHRNRWGETALGIAIQRGDILGIDLLMEYGADIDLPNGNGDTVRETFVSAGATVTAAMERWLLKRSGKEEAPMASKRCDKCKVEQKSLKVCSGCHTVQYCSTVCQRAAWLEHKNKCKRFNASSTLKLKPYYLPEEIEATGIPQEPFRRGFIGGLPTAPVPKSRMRMSQPPKNLPPSGKQVVVKIQIPTELKDASGVYGDMLVYTQKRDFACFLRRQDGPNSWDRLYKIIKEKSLSGLKGYFVADLKSRDEFTVKVSELLASQPW